MKNNIFETIVTTFCVLLLVTSCIPQDELNQNTRPAYVDLSLTEIMLPNKKTDVPNAPQVIVKSNREDIKVISLEPEWLAAEYREKGIFISAKPNLSGVKRQTSVLVIAGEAREFITVTQSNAVVTLEVSNTDVALSATGESILVDVNSGGIAWEIEVEEETEWMTAARVGDFIQIKAMPNNTAKTRNAKIYVRMGTKVAEISVSQQAGTKSEKFALPMLERKATVHSIIAFEERQGNFLLNYTPGEVFAGMVMDGTISFLYESPVYTDIVYKVNPSNGIITEIVMTSHDPKTLQSDAYMQYLKDRGFVITKSNRALKQGQQTYSGTNIDAAYAIDMKINDSPDVASTITLKSRGRQLEAYPTFKEFPFDKYEYLNGWTYARIKANEISEGSELLYETPDKNYPNVIYEAQFNVPEASRPLAARIFGMNVKEIDPSTGKPFDKLDQLVAVFGDLHLGAFFTDDKYFLTEEFQDLMVRSGFKYIKETDGLSQWYNDDKKLLIIPRGTRFGSVLDLTPVLAISYFHRDLSGMTNAQISATLMQARIEVNRQDKLLGAVR